MAELLGERLLAWPAGLLVPFLIAAVMKSLQGSSLVAAIATAGMVQPLLTPLGTRRRERKSACHSRRRRRRHDRLPRQ